MTGTTLAPPGTVYVCSACGRRSRTRNGWGADNKSTKLDSGWDSSCTTHAVLCWEERGADGNWKAVVKS